MRVYRHCFACRHYLCTAHTGACVDIIVWPSLSPSRQDFIERAAYEISYLFFLWNLWAPERKVKLLLIPSWETILSLTVYPRLYVWLVIRDVRTKEMGKKRVEKRERRGTHEAGKREKGKEIERGGRVRGPWYENNNCVSSFSPFLINYTSAPPSLGLWCMSSTQDRYAVFCLTRWGEHSGWKL